MNSKKVGQAAGIGAGAVVLALAGYNLAGATTSSTVPAEQAGSGVNSGSGYGLPGSGSGMLGQGPGAGETVLTGETAERVTAAAQAAVPGGTVDRAETDAEGVYEAHVTKSDGTHVIVAVDESFTVTGIEEMPAGMGPGSGRGGPGGAGSGETPLTGRKAARVKAAALQEIPGGTVTRVETDSDGVYEAHVTRKNGTEVVVQVNNSFAVTGVQQLPAPPSGAPSGTTPSGAA